MMPTTLYKYCGPDRRDILDNRRIRFTQPSALNDVFEMSPVGVDTPPARWAELLKGVKEEYSHLAYIPNFNPPVPTGAKKQQDAREVLEDALVLCLTSRWDSLPMWAYYAQAHEGFVLGFDKGCPFLNGVKEVQYAPSPPLFYGPSEGDFERAIFTKSEEWRHEDEWRAMRTSDDESLMPCDPRGSSPIYCVGFDAQCVTEVILGNRIRADVRECIMGILDRPGYEHVKVWQAKPSDDSFKLEREPIERSLPSDSA